jgi:hypothetical protein
MLKYQETRDTIGYLYLPAAHQNINSHLPRQSLSELETQCYYGSATRTEVIVALTPRSRQARYHERGDVDCAMMAFADFHHRIPLQRERRDASGEREFLAIRNR